MKFLYGHGTKVRILCVMQRAELSKEIMYFNRDFLCCNNFVFKYILNKS